MLLDCQESYSSIGIAYFFYEEDHGSNPPSPNYIIKNKKK